MKQSTHIFAIVVALSGICACATTPKPTDIAGATTVDVVAAKALYDRGVRFVDVRGSNSYSKGHVRDAVNLELTVGGASGEAKLAKVVNKDQEVVLYCGGLDCKLSSKATEMAVSWGFKNVYYFPGGYPAWRGAGYPTSR